MKFAFIGKLAALFAAVIALMFGVSEIRGVLHERMSYSASATENIIQSHSASQAILGPAITMRCTEKWPVVVGTGKDRKEGIEQREFQIRSAPKKIVVDAKAHVEPRHRGIYKVNTYSVKSSITANWDDLSDLVIKPSQPKGNVSCSTPQLFVAVTDTRGIRAAKITVSDAIKAVIPGTDYAPNAAGFHAPLEGIELNTGHPLIVTLLLELSGSDTLGFVPLGSETQIQLSGNWPHPSFQGRFLPSDKPVITDQGFNAIWRVSALASSAQRSFLEEVSDEKSKAQHKPVISDSFWVSFIDPVNPYSLSDRATKYALLFIVMTFAAVGLLEIVKRLRVHPVQYFLSGAALSLFFLLLISLSEHMPFEAAYAIASLSCAALLTFYASYMLGSSKSGLLFGLAVGALYGGLYVMLQLEQASLLMGSVLLFMTLGLVMFITRKLNWYALADLTSLGLSKTKPTDMMPTSK